MAAIILPRKHYTQPSGFAEANFSSGLLDGCARLYNLNGGLRNAITGAGFYSTQRPTPAQIGVGASFNGTSDFFTADAQPAHEGAFTAIAFVRTTTGSGTRNIFSYGSGTAYQFQGRQDGSHYHAYMAATSPVDRLARASDAVVVGKTQFVAVRWGGPGTDFTIYVDGSLRGANAAVPLQLRVADALNIGRENAVTQYWQGNIFLFGWWARHLSISELQEIEFSPWQLFRADPVRIYSLPPVLTVPTLSVPGVIDIGTTSARPQVTLTY